MVSTTERALSRGPAPAGSPLGPVSRPGRDLVVALLVGAALVLLVRARAGVDYRLPVTLGNGVVENGDEVLADAEARLQELAESQGGRIAEEAGCYFWRPLGSSQGAVDPEQFGGLLSSLGDAGGLGFEDAEAMDIVLCGPADLTPSGLMEGLPAQEPWVTGVVTFVTGSQEASFRGEVQTLLPMPLATLTATGGVQADSLLDADGRSPDQDELDDPTWIEVEGTGEGGGLGIPGISVPEMPDLPDDIELPDGMELPDLEGMPDGSGPPAP